MAVLAVTNTLVEGATIFASEHNTNYSDIVTYINNRYNGTDTWLNMKVSATAANPVDVSGSGSTTEVSINNSATDGDPILTFKLSGSQTHVIGVDDGDSDFLKFATTGLATNVAMQIPTTGAQVQFNAGSVGTPSISIIGDTDIGMYKYATNSIGFSCAGVVSLVLDANNRARFTDGTAALPSIALLNDQDTGLYSVSGDVIGLSTGGGNAGQVGVFGGVTQFQGRDGTVAAPYWSFVNDPDTGFYRIGANQVGGGAGGAVSISFDASATAGNTRLLVYDVDNATLERVTVGASDSGGAGYKVLRIPN